ncbi:hypothetical protein TH53_20925 [Pedobacter lusitanus]|uniref:F5/8 type C domain-containing protein n=1 Tax=Pedobacter lusitanus TaxID=1503925 RepID=A0A0D0GH54_9SPHI|nr:discoidin domain-containing protein [Pedobacter lusitanus]KIO75435.1 hypothetical protein TH53_20925 [Pedobacter lusitanus]
MKKTTYLLLLFLTIFLSCKKNTIVTEPVNKTSSNSDTTYTSDYAYNLNVVYFIASDKTANDDYQRRISEIMLKGQDFFSKWMDHWGFGNRGFGLLKNQAGDRIKIIEIHGKYDQSKYPYTDTGALQTEVNDYFTVHPEDKSSEHTLIIMCVKDINKDNAPFFGVGRTCFALDYPGMEYKDLGAAGTPGSEATKWIGGMMHELGHGINLPHNGGQKSENAQFGTSLMGAGNSTYGKAPTYLTKADCAILNNCQVFSKTTRTGWYTAPDTRITSIHAKYEGGNIIVSGKFTGTTVVNYINFYNDGAKNGIGGNKDYDAVPWSTPKIGLDSFYVSMPYSEFTNTEDYPYELRIMFCSDNGSLINAPYSYAIRNGQPVIDFGDKNEYNKANWQVIDFSSNETVSEDGKAANVIDKNANTSWVTRWSSNAPTFPHYLTINMGQALEVGGFTFTQRAGSSKIKDMQLLTSNDNITWTSIGNYTLKDSGGPQFVYLPAAKIFQYFKIMVTSATDGRQYASLAEVGTFKN